jgi:AcrR family transcriptional regulator
VRATRAAPAWAVTGDPRHYGEWMPRKPDGVTRSLILEQAERLFLERGFLGTSVRDIASACDVTVPALYYYFSSKDDIVSAWCEPLVVDSERVLESLDACDRSDPVVFERRALELYYDVLARHERVFRVVSTDRGLRSHPLAGHRLAELAARFLELLSGTDPTRRLGAVAAIGAIRHMVRVLVGSGNDAAGLRPLAVECAHAALTAPSGDTWAPAASGTAPSS